MARTVFRNILTILTLTLIGVDVGVAAERRAQQVAWSDVHSAVAGAKIKMVLPSGTEIQGRLLEVGPEALTMDVTKTSNSKEIGKGKASIPRASVSAIDARKCGIKWRLALSIGLPAGLVGAAGAAINTQSPTVKSQDAAGVILGIGAGSAVAGYFVGKQLDCRDTDITVIPEGPGDR